MVPRVSGEGTGLAHRPGDRLDPAVCYEALCSRDPRFDGRFFVGVVTTGVFCRPICPAGPAKRVNCRFFPSAAAALKTGFRPCLRCRPESAPQSGAWRGTTTTVSRGLALIAAGALDGEHGVEHLDERLGVGVRQLRRLFHQHLGASPLAIAQARRVLFATQLIRETRLPLTEVALASGFGSVRRFNELFRSLFNNPPSRLRSRTGAGQRAPAGDDGAVVLQLRYRAPYDFAGLLAHFGARAIHGIEGVDDTTYRRSIDLDQGHGTIEVRDLPQADALLATIRVPSVATLPTVAAKIRTVFDVELDPQAVSQHLARDAQMAPLVGARPGLRVPGGWDGFEVGVRAILGQQVTVAHARRLLDQFVTLPRREQADGPRRFPRACEIKHADLRELGIPEARRRAIAALAECAEAEPTLFCRGATVEESVSRLRQIKGVGEWTAQYIALRAVGEPDAFPAADASLLGAAAALFGQRYSPAQLLARADRWRPWRGYAAQYLWALAAGSLARPVRVRR